MRRMMFIGFSSMALVAACGPQVEVRTERVGCTSNAQCDDGSEATDDYCSVSDGVCNHVRMVATACMNDRQCDDHDDQTTDRCDTVTGICQHSRFVPAYDPASPERQDAAMICEDARCAPPASGPYAEVMWAVRCGVHVQRESWMETGYPLWIHLHRIGTLDRIRIAPQLRVGSQLDRYSVRLRMNEERSTPVAVRELSVAEIQRGFEIGIGSVPRLQGWDDDLWIMLDLQPVGDAQSRTIQWALPTGGLTDAETDADLVPCLTVGEFMTVPRHGFLHLQEDGMTVQCAGSVRQLDIPYTDEMPSGLFRTQSDPAVTYVNTQTPPTTVTFQGLRGFMDWFQPNTVCAQVSVYPDSVIRRLPDRHTTVGVRPGVAVVWHDAENVRHYGMADRDWVIRDIGTGAGTARTLMGVCTRFNADWAVDCALDLDPLVGISPYRMVPTDPNADPGVETQRESIEQYFQLR